MKYIALLLAAIGSNLLAQTLTLQNISNTGLSPDFVSGDSFKVEITGAAPYKPVTLSMWRNGVRESNQWYAGETDENGHFDMYGQETDDFIAEFYEQWYVDGTEFGPFLDFEVIYKPSFLEVTAVDLVDAPLPECQGWTYGISVDVKYQLKNPNGEPVTTLTGIPLLTWEVLADDSYSGPIGPVSGYPTSSDRAAADGTFHDVPIGVCWNYAFGDVLLPAQDIFIIVKDNPYIVRADQIFEVDGPSPNHGSISNGDDIDKIK